MHTTRILLLKQHSCLLIIVKRIFFFSLLIPVCWVCWARFDSWAGMALARASCIQDKLNSNELKNDGPVWKHSLPVLTCFRRALEIDSSNLALWIEYGTMSFALHSFASRQLKQWKKEMPNELVKLVSGKGGGGYTARGSGAVPSVVSA